MLVFSTRLPIRSTVTRPEILQLCLNWVSNSPHYNVHSLQYDPVSLKDTDYENEGLRVFIRNYTNADCALSAFRVEFTNKNILWQNDVILLEQSIEKTLLVQLECNRADFGLHLPVVHKPYLVRMAVEQGLCSTDHALPVTDSPILLDEVLYPVCVSIMNGTCLNTMPVVYLSCSENNAPGVPTAVLAQRLSGMAHVLQEDSYRTAQRLRDDTQGSNVYGGYIGLYFPGSSRCQRFCPDLYSSTEALLQEIVNAVRCALINQADASNYNWNQIQTLQARQQMKAWIDRGTQSQQDLDAYIENFDRENAQLRERLQLLNDSLLTMTAQRDRLQMQLSKTDSSTGELLKPGAEAELYPGEATDLLNSILTQVLPKLPPNSRSAALVESLLAANPSTGQCHQLVQNIREVFFDGGRLNSAKKSLLRETGFEILEDGPHYKLIFCGDHRYQFSFPKTPSDTRGGRNNISEMCKRLDVEKKFL